VATYLRGKLVFDGKNVLAEAGTGAFVRPPTLRPSLAKNEPVAA
jgi:hypothetical protein